MGAYWSITEDAEKPVDKRVRSGRYIKVKTYKVLFEMTEKVVLLNHNKKEFEKS